MKTKSVKQHRKNTKGNKMKKSSQKRSNGTNKPASTRKTDKRKAIEQSESEK